MNLFKKIGVAIVGMAMAVGVGVAVGDKNSVKVKADGNYELVYTLDGTDQQTNEDNQNKASAYDKSQTVTQSTVTWEPYANTTTNPWRIGGKGGSETDSTTTYNRAIYSTAAISGNIVKVEVSSGTKTLNSINSLTISVHSNQGDAASGSNEIASVTESTASNIISKTVTLLKNDQTSWAGKYYRIVYNITAKGKSNQYIQFLNAKFYIESNKQDTSVTINNSTPFVLTAGNSATQLSVTTSPANLALTYSSGDTSVATVDANGNVTPVAKGVAKITASYAGDNSYKASSATIDAYVLKATSAIPSSGTLTINVDSLDKIGTGTSYTDYNGYHYTAVDDSEAEVVWNSNQCMPATGDNSGKIQMQSGVGKIYNYISLNNILDVTVNGSGTVVKKYGTSADNVSLTTLTDGCGYFSVEASGTAYINSIVVTYGTPEVIPNPTSLTMDTKQLALETEQTAEEALTFTTDSSKATFAWHTENSDLATVDSGVVTAKTTAGSVKIYVYFDSNENGQFDLTDLNDYCTVTITIPEVDYSSVTYGGVGTLITESNATQLIANNKKIVLAYNASSAIAGTLSGGYLASVTNSQSTPIAFSNDKTTVTIGDGTAEVSIMVLTLETNGDYYSLKMKSGHYLGCGSSAGSSLSDQTDKDAYTWDVTYSGITATTDNENLLQYNSGSPRFKTYKTSSNMKSIQLYSFVEYSDEALEYAETFIKGNGTANTCAATIQNWTSLETTFNTTLSDGAKNLFKTATHNPSDTYTTANEYTIQHAVARYDDALLKHAELRTHEFMDRVAAGTLSYSSYIGGLVKERTNTAVIVVISSLATITAFGAFLFLKKRKEQ